MLKRLSEASAVPMAVLAFLAIAGLAGFAAIIGIATYAGLVALWPDMPFALALAVAILGPLVFVAGVGIACAKHDQWAGDAKAARWLKLLKWVAPAGVVAYLAFEAFRALL